MYRRYLIKMLVYIIFFSHEEIVTLENEEQKK